ncbi:MAG: cation transporter [Puniceicoccaceae bacterium]|nr:MAG: cation transporter [Puniceicoccaceae bacterium]
MKKHHSASSKQPKESRPADPIQAGVYCSFPLQRPVAVLSRLLGFTLLWWVLSEGRWQDPFLILAILLIATFCSLRLWPPGVWKLSPLHVLAFLPYFFWQSLCGGFDVARRAFQIKPALSPETVTMTMDLRPESACLFAWVVSLLPGTACIHKNGTSFQIHLLDANSESKVHQLEQRINRLGWDEGDKEHP